MFKLVQTIKSSFFIIILVIANNLYSFGQNSNQVNQSNSKNANTQIGNGNSSKIDIQNKTDNRKFNKTINNNQQELNSYSGPLFSGDNPFVIINNINPNKDSINYEIQLKKKTIRIALSRFMVEGFNLRNRCFTEKDTTYSDLINTSTQWNEKVFNYLLNNLDESYARQFDLAVSYDALSFTLPDKIKGLHDFIRIRIRKIDEFITSLY